MDRERAVAEEKGIEKGIEKGSYERAVVIALKMLENNRPIEEIMEYTDLTRKQVESLRDNEQ